MRWSPAFFFFLLSFFSGPSNVCRASVFQLWRVQSGYSGVEFGVGYGGFCDGEGGGVGEDWVWVFDGGGLLVG